MNDKVLLNKAIETIYYKMIENEEEPTFINNNEQQKDKKKLILTFHELCTDNFTNSTNYNKKPRGQIVYHRKSQSMGSDYRNTINNNNGFICFYCGQETNYKRHNKCCQRKKLSNCVEEQAAAESLMELSKNVVNKK